MEEISPNINSKQKSIIPDRNRDPRKMIVARKSNGYNLREAHKSARCQECGKLMRLGELEKHIMTYHTGRKIMCPQCAKIFPDKSSLTRHILLHKANLKREPPKSGKDNIKKRDLSYGKKNESQVLQEHSKDFNLDRTSEKSVKPVSIQTQGISPTQNLMNSIRRKYNLTFPRQIPDNKHNVHLHGRDKSLTNGNGSLNHQEVKTKLFRDGDRNGGSNVTFVPQSCETKSTEEFEYNTPTFLDFDQIEHLQVAEFADTKRSINEKQEIRHLYPLPKMDGLSSESKPILIQLKTETIPIPGTELPSPQITMCPICFKSFPLGHLNLHMQVHKPHKCQYCEKSYSKRFEVIQHEYSHTGERPYRCEDCGNTFRYKSNWCRHKRSHRKGQGPTTSGQSQCRSNINSNYYFPNEKGEHKVLSSTHTPAPSKLGPWELCKFSGFEDEDETPVDVDPLSEDPVDLALQLQYNLPDLIIEVIDPEPEPDPEPVSVSYEIQNQSLRQVQIPKNASQLYCHLCQKSFPSQRHFTFHKRQHVDRRVICKICNKTFAHRFSLTQHALVHTGEMPFTCNICDKHFRFKSNYTKHNRQHHPVLVHELDRKQRKSMEIDMKCQQPQQTHIQNREQSNNRNNCGYCDANFEDSSELRLHVLSHKLGLSYERTSNNSN